MMNKLFHKEEGNTFILMALVMMMLLGILGLVVDGGHLYMTKSHLQKTVNAATLSGAQELPNSDEKVNQVIGEILTHHGEPDSLLFSNIESDNELHVGIESDVPVFFSSLFGIDSVTLQAEARASLMPIRSGVGVVPLGVPESMDFEYGETFPLKVGAGDSENGNFGILALEGRGANSYEQTLKYGYGEPLEVGEIIDTQPGNIAGATKNGVDYRISNCPDGNYQQRDCSRIMLVPVYRPYNHNGGRMQQVEITGFAYFYLTESMNSEHEIKGVFIRRAGSGTTGMDAPLDRGAYTIKLTR